MKRYVYDIKALNLRMMYSYDGIDTIIDIQEYNIPIFDINSIVYIAESKSAFKDYPFTYYEVYTNYTDCVQVTRDSIDLIMKALKED